MRSVTFALVLALAASSFTTMASAAPTAGSPPGSAPPAAKPAPAKPTALQRALRVCAKAKDQRAKVACQRRAYAQAKAARKPTTVKRPPPPAPTPVTDTTN